MQPTSKQARVGFIFFLGMVLTCTVHHLTPYFEGSFAQSEASHGSAQSALAEWGDALDESDSVSDDDDADGAGSGRRGWMEGLPQAREMETLEKMLMRVQEMYAPILIVL